MWDGGIQRQLPFIIYIILRKQTLETGFRDWVTYKSRSTEIMGLVGMRGERDMDNSWCLVAAWLPKQSWNDSKRPSAVEGKAWGDQVAVGLNCYSDSHVCKDRGNIWLLLWTLVQGKWKSLKIHLRMHIGNQKASMTTWRNPSFFVTAELIRLRGKG